MKKVVINGETYDNLTMFLDKLYSFEFWKEIFENDYYSDIHGGFDSRKYCVQY